MSFFSSTVFVPEEQMELRNRSFMRSAPSAAESFYNCSKAGDTISLSKTLKSDGVQAQAFHALVMSELKTYCKEKMDIYMYLFHYLTKSRMFGFSSAYIQQTFQFYSCLYSGNLCSDVHL